MNGALTVENLCVSYGAHKALSDLSFSAKPGQVTGLVGPNGAGKTTLIKALCGRVIPDSGDMRIGQTDLSRGRSRQKLIGLVPQDIGLYPHLTARENLSVFAKMMGVPKDDRAAITQGALQAVNLLDKSSERVEALSGGMKRRINVAAAIMHSPKLLILDEPTAGVDLPARDAIHALAADLAKSGMAVLLVTHELEQAEVLCGEILILAGGRKYAFGAPPDILSAHFKNAREVSLRFAAPPNPAAVNALAAMGFHQHERATILTSMTDMSETNIVQSVMNAISDQENLLQELTLRKPGLPSLMKEISLVEPASC